MKRQAWQIRVSLEDCVLVKAFGRCSNHAKELNWLCVAAEGYIREGLSLSSVSGGLKLGCITLRANVARDNGAEWTGAVCTV